MTPLQYTLADAGLTAVIILATVIIFWGMALLIVKSDKPTGPDDLHGGDIVSNVSEHRLPRGIKGVVVRRLSAGYVLVDFNNTQLRVRAAHLQKEN